MHEDDDFLYEEKEHTGENPYTLRVEIAVWSAVIATLLQFIVQHP